MMRIVYRNPLELWGEPSYNEPWISISGGIGGPLIQRLQFRRWDDISTFLIVIVGFIVVVDFLSSTIRRRLV